jgi:hypothetical protein
MMVVFLFETVKSRKPDLFGYVDRVQYDLRQICVMSFFLGWVLAVLGAWELL